MYRTIAISLLAVGTAVAPMLTGAEGPTAKPYTPAIAPASGEGVKALKRIRVPQGFRIDLFAAEPMLANPVAFCIDGKNRFYVAETHRLHAGVTDIRGHMDWLDDDLACRTVEDRVALLKRRVKGQAASFAVEHDRVRMLEDTTGSGRADRSTVFADGFNHIEDGIGAGLLARGGDVWYACIPDLWRLSDPAGEGVARTRQRLHHGYGVHVGYLGHDLHGLRLGPDGKLYFSIGDRGLDVRTPAGRLSYPDTGCVLRCNPDGSDLEVFATGLRNPQELAFDAHGNLFTGDNNSDGGDRARWVYVVEGGDSGWRIGYQFGSVTGPRGPFMAERLWEPRWRGQAAYIVPPLANIANGPSGLACYPGLGLPERYRGHFFLCDFRGGAGGSGVLSFAVEPDGAAFRVADRHEFIWSVLATDVDFGTDCALYVSDWVEGWNKPNKGRLYKVSDPVLAKGPAVQEVKKLMAEGMAGRSNAELARLLGHKDMRVRQEAQFALAGREAAAAVDTLAGVARGGTNLLARLHAVWGLGQVGRKNAAASQPLLPLLRDREAEVRAQAAKVLGDNRVAAASAGLIGLLKDPEVRVRFFAAQALGRVGSKEAVPEVLAMLRANADRDAYLRHAGVMALAGGRDTNALLAAAKDPATPVRLGVLLALRRLGSPEVACFLDDPDPGLVLEAARAVHDLPIESALPRLAALVGRPALPEALGYRVLNANFRLGGPANAAAVAAFAARPDAPESLRVEALHELRDWAKPAGRDRVMGLWRPLAPRPPQVATDAVWPRMRELLGGPDRIRGEAVKLAAALGMKEVGPALLDMVADPRRPAPVRVEAMKAMETLGTAGLDRAMQTALKDADARVRTEARRLLAHSRPDEALTELARVVSEGAAGERQGAFAILGDMKGAGADGLLVKSLDDLLGGRVLAEARLDLLDAAGRRTAPAVKERLKRYEAAHPGDGPAGRYRDCLVGGDAAAGRRIFFTKAEVSCLRCHKVKGEGGEVGPDMTGIGSRQARDYLLESIVEPNRQIAKGFETVVLTLKNGKSQTGVLKAEDAREVRLMTAEGKLVVVPVGDIDERETGKSAMPEDVTKHLSRREIRDLVEFLSSLK